MNRARRNRRFFVIVAVGMLGIASPLALSAAGGSGAELRARVASASALEKAGRWAEAREAWLALAGDHPGNRRVWLALERVHKRVEDDGRYLAWLREQVREFPGEPVLFRQYLSQAVRAGVPDGLDEAIRRHLEAGSGSDAFYRELGTQLSRFDLADRAEEVYRAGRRAGDDPYRFARELSDLCFRSGRYRESLEEALHALLREPDALEFVRRRAAEVGGWMSNVDRLDLVADFARGPGKGVPAFARLLAGLQEDAGEPGEALATLRGLAALDPDASVRDLEAFAKRRADRGDLPDALEARRTLEEREPTRRLEHEMEIARLYGAMGEPKRAIERYRRLLDSGPEVGIRGRVLLGLGESELYGRHRSAEAIAWLERIDPAVADADLAVDAALDLAVARAFANDPEGAAREAARAAALPPPAEREIEVVFLEAEAEIAAGRPERGRMLLARVARRRGHPLSNDAIEMMLWLDRDTDTDSEIARALVLHRLTRRVDDAKRAIERLETIRKRCGDCALGAEIGIELADACRAADRGDDAVAVLESTLSDFPDHRLVPRIEWTLAEILRARGETARARAHLERILREFGSGVYAPRARRMIEAMDRAGEPVSRGPAGALDPRGGMTG